ncbi:MAG: hypothetical protein FD123_3547, partial [Bacteroidetes bacterium]
MKTILLSVLMLGQLFAFAGGDEPKYKSKPVKKPKTVKTLSGLEYTVTAKGNGPQATEGDFLKVHYTGTLTDGKKFDSSFDRNQPHAFSLGRGQVIKGW